MEDALTSLWENLSLTDTENATIKIDSTKLLAPSNALIGRLAMKKHVTTLDLEKSLRIMWEVPASLDVTLLNENLFMFEFKDARACDRIFNKQPWNYRGSLLILSRIRGDECPTYFTLSTVPFWVQIHGLQIRAMNSEVGKTLGALLGDYLKLAALAVGPRGDDAYGYESILMLQSYSLDGPLL